MQVLIVEDKVERVDFFCRLYSSYEVSIAEDVDEARSLLESGSFDFVQLDYDLHERNSSEIVDLIDRESIVIIHSENSAGAKRLKSRIPRAIVISYHHFRDKKSGVSQLKALLASGIQELAQIKRWFEEYESEVDY